MTEPEYTFVKGEGWVVRRHNVWAFTSNGRNYVLEERRPQIGENHLLFRDDKGNYDPQHLVDVITRCGYKPHDYSPWTEKLERTNFMSDYRMFVFKELP